MHKPECVSVLLFVQNVFIFKQVYFVYMKRAFCRGVCVFKQLEERGLCVGKFCLNLSVLTFM